MTEHGHSFELLPGCLAPSDRLLDFLDVMRKPCQLFGDVGLLDHDHGLLRDAIRADFDARAGRNLLYALLVVGDHLLPDVVAVVVELLLQFSDRFEAAEDVGLEGAPFVAAHVEQFRKGLTHDPRQRLPLLIRHLGLNCLYLQ